MGFAYLIGLGLLAQSATIPEQLAEFRSIATDIRDSTGVLIECKGGEGISVQTCVDRAKELQALKDHLGSQNSYQKVTIATQELNSSNNIREVDGRKSITKDNIPKGRVLKHVKNKKLLRTYNAKYDALSFKCSSHKGDGCWKTLESLDGTMASELAQHGISIINIASGHGYRPDKGAIDVLIGGSIRNSFEIAVAPKVYAYSKLAREVERELMEEGVDAQIDCSINDFTHKACRDFVLSLHRVVSHTEVPKALSEKLGQTEIYIRASEEDAPMYWSGNMNAIKLNVTATSGHLETTLTEAAQ